MQWTGEGEDLLGTFTITAEELADAAENQMSDALRDNVNRVTDRLTPRNPQVMTLSTLREMMRSVAPADSLDEPEIEGMARVAATFYDLLAGSDPNLAKWKGWTADLCEND